MISSRTMKRAGLFFAILGIILAGAVHLVTAGNPTGDPGEDQWLKWWRWGGGDWTTIVQGSHVAPSPGLYTCKNGPLWVTVTLRDRDAWNNYGEHYHADGIIKHIMLTDGASENPNHIWGSSSTLLAEPNGGVDKTDRTYKAESIACTAPDRIGAIPMNFRGIDITEAVDEHGAHNDPQEFGDDPVIGEANPPNVMAETGSEYCSAAGVIWVFTVTVNVQGSVPGDPKNICSNSTNAKNAQVTIDIAPDDAAFTVRPQIPIKLVVTGSACFGYNGITPIKEVTLTDSGASSATLVWDNTAGHGEYTITPYFVTGTTSTAAGRQLRELFSKWFL